MSHIDEFVVGPFTREGSSEPTIIRVQTNTDEVRRIQVSFAVSGDEYWITSNTIECSVKNAQLVIEALSLLFGPQPD
jgi:hypothetical protein